MGYELHITRRQRWSDRGHDIGADEWHALVASDPALAARLDLGPHVAEWRGASLLETPWLDWCEGRIFSKNPDPPLVKAMVAFACRLGATVQGDDGERYDDRGEAVRPARSVVERLAAWFAARRTAAKPASASIALPFGVGDRVRDTFGNEYTVTAIDPAAEHGLGAIRLKRDDGTALAHAMRAHGLAPVRSAPR